MKKILFIALSALVMSFALVSNANAQGFFKKAGSFLKKEVASAVNNNMVTKANVDTLLIQQGTNEYVFTGVTFVFKPDGSSKLLVQSNCSECKSHGYYKAKITKEDNGDIKLFAGDDLVLYIYEHEGHKFGILNNQGVIIE